MKIRITHDIPDDYRRAINAQMGRPGLASRKDVILHIESTIDGDAQTIGQDVDDEEEER